ncbi:hypothetical protein GCM10011390_35150 [Aureimonas endophytica]|uniref:Methyltransferase domain-containing protein n=1 Tax=Aureimonas endophytica TaxID=2027858 RepID=A0A917E967_9HYPH|nr:bifunctional PIG-L family deacetylase/class I SAM-dependent methyltransferase [Aureimonas endophytica]GGE13005.1 hypothetical protein GCM10011390_35150 [Aureimonas endophytica]
MTLQTIGAWNAAMAGAPRAPAERLIGPGGLVVLSPHPDDETLGASALLTRAADLGRRIGLVALTDGEGSHPRSRLVPPPRLAAIRAAEQAAALAALGCGAAEVLRLSLPDGASGRSAGFETAAARIAALCDAVGASALAAPHPDDPHPDHHAAAALALALGEARPDLRILFYEVWSRRLAAAEPFRAEGLTPFRVAADPARKRAALACHRSQLGEIVPDDPDGFVLPPWFLAAQDDPWERYSWRAMPGRPPEPGHFARLYAADGDPWHVRSSAYEAEKRAATVAILEPRHFRHALEAGCGEGFLSRALLGAGIAERVTGFDREPAIVARAARHPETGALADFVSGSLPDDLPDGRFDLAVFSEVLYFLEETALARLAAALPARLVPDAEILIVSYLGRTDTPLGGRAASDFFVACLGEAVTPVKATETPDYRIERLRYRPAPGAVPAPEGGDPTGAAARA